MDKISIGIPTYNRPSSLKRTLDSLLRQSYLNLEIVISDNCSPNPEVKKLIELYCKKDKRIVVYFQPNNIGMTMNFRFVLENATGRFFMWKADDDVIEDKDFIKKLYTKLLEKGCDFVFPESYYLKKDGQRKPILKGIYENCKNRFEYLNAITKSFACLEFYGLYDISKFSIQSEFNFMEDVGCPDVFYLPNLFLNHDVEFVPETYYIFVHEPSADSFQRSLNLYKDRQAVLRKLIRTFASTDVLNSNQRSIIVSNILTYYEEIIKEHYSIKKIDLLKINVKNMIKRFIGKAKS